ILNIAINTTVSSVNEDEVAKIKEYWGDDVYFICNPTAKLGNAVRNWNKLITDDISLQRQSELIKKLSETGGPLTLGSNGLCGYSEWGISVSPSGEFMTCAYTTQTNGLFGNIKNTSLEEAFRYKHAMESKHFQRYGVYPCLVRADSFDIYIKELRVSHKN
ncbi:hypothetical protein HY636_04720, partial [Candidatus Woesearchaeota archaeon]|nr:hypothetical protein [Candidatus Woesearchaeota archaeon]